MHAVELPKFFDYPNLVMINSILIEFNQGIGGTIHHIQKLDLLFRIFTPDQFQFIQK